MNPEWIETEITKDKHKLGENKNELKNESLKKKNREWYTAHVEI